MMEIERKFLLNPQYIEFISTLDVQSYNLAQYYVKIGSEEERYRSVDEKYFHTVKKSIDGGLTREEKEQPCLRDEYLLHQQEMLGDVVEKTRKIYFSGNQKIEIDIYKGKLLGLIICEIEFGDAEEASAFTPLFFFGAEVTLDKRYKNQSLAINGIPK